MDLLFKRYASPLILLDNMIAGNRLFNFIVEFMQMCRDENEKEKEWEFFLHKVHDMSFEEFQRKIRQEAPEQKPEAAAATYDEQYVETTIQNSRNILKRFNLK